MGLKARVMIFDLAKQVLLVNVEYLEGKCTAEKAMSKIGKLVDQFAESSETD